MTAAYIDSPIGPFTIAAGERIERICYGRVNFQNANMGGSPLIAEAERQFAEYFAGTRTRFELPLNMRGTEFQLKVWRAMMEIPYGDMLSYGALATAVGHPSAARAVGSACRANPFSLVVPCHRVVAANGIGSFGGQNDIKIYLIDHEKSVKKRLTESKKAI